MEISNVCAFLLWTAVSGNQGLEIANKRASQAPIIAKVPVFHFSFLTIIEFQKIFVFNKCSHVWFS